MKPLIGPEPYTTEWYEMRSDVIGASEAAAACGQSPYKQPLDLYLEKRGEVVDEGNPDAKRLGHALEPVVISEYEYRTGRTVRKPPGMFIHPEHQFIVATLDGITEEDGEEFAVDAKTTTFRRKPEFGEEGSDHIPPDMILQGQQQILVSGYDRVDFAVLFDGRTLKIYTVRRHQELIDHIVECETELIRRIKDCDPPEPDYQHKASLDLVRAMHKDVHAGATANLGKDARELWDEYQRLGDIYREVGKERKAIKAKILKLIGDNQFGVLPGGVRELVRRKVKGGRAVYTRKPHVRLDERSIGE